MAVSALRLSNLNKFLVCVRFVCSVAYYFVARMSIEASRTFAFCVHKQNDRIIFSFFASLRLPFVRRCLGAALLSATCEKKGRDCRFDLLPRAAIFCWCSITSTIGICI